MNGGDKRFSCMAADGNQVIGSHKRNTGPMLTSPRCPARPSRPMPRPEGGLRAAGIARRRQPSERADLGGQPVPSLEVQRRPGARVSLRKTIPIERGPQRARNALWLRRYGVTLHV
jgi:hypothetical protein